MVKVCSVSLMSNKSFLPRHLQVLPGGTEKRAAVPQRAAVPAAAGADLGMLEHISERPDLLAEPGFTGTDWRAAGPVQEQVQNQHQDLAKGPFESM